jgi:hypothetical protein
MSCGCGSSINIPTGPAGSQGVSLVYSPPYSIVGTGPDTTEDTLYSYTLPGNTIISFPAQVVIETLIFTASDNNNKTIKIYFGSSFIELSYPLNGLQLKVIMTVNITSATSAYIDAITIANSTIFSGQSTLVNYLTPFTTNLTSNQVIKVTGQNSVASAGEIQCPYMNVKYILS